MTRRSRPLAVAFAVLMLGALGVTVAHADDIILFKNPKPAPALQVTTLDGHVVSLAALRGKVVLLNFWATWCGPCKAEIPELEQLQRKYPSRLEIVGLSIDEAPPREVAAFARQLNINYPVAMASAAVQMRFGGIPAVPTTVVVDRSGNIVQKNRGLNPISVFDSEIRALLDLPFQGHVARIDEMAPDGPVGTTQIPGLIDAFKNLTPAQRQKALARLNSVACTCGCDWSVASCRVQDPGCAVSLPLGRKILTEIAEQK